LRRRGEPHRPRGREGRGDRVLRRVVHLRSVRPHHRGGVAEQAGGARRRGRSAGRRDRAPALAVPARPPDRRVRPHHGTEPREAMTPRGTAMPAEWAPHRATWIGWPHNKADWPGKFEPIPWAYAEIVRVLSRRERVCILVQDAAAEKKAKAVLKKASVDLKRVDFYRIPTDRVWTRDSGAIFVKDPEGRKIATHWKF